MPEKKFGVLDYGIFDFLDSLRERYNLTNEEWSDFSGLPLSRISAYRNRAKNRAWTIDKARKLINGLSKKIGAKVLNKELMDKIEKTKNEKEKALLALLLGFDDNDPAMKSITDHILAVLKSKD